jgi:hypothetical protein
MPAGGTADRVAAAKAVLPFVSSTPSRGAIAASARPVSQRRAIDPNPPQRVPKRPGSLRRPAAVPLAGIPLPSGPAPAGPAR